MPSKVLTEFGSKHGFSLIAEARQFFLAEMAGIVNKEESEERKVRIFSPCPHAQACPMLNEKKMIRRKSKKLNKKNSQFKKAAKQTVDNVDKLVDKLFNSKNKMVQKKWYD